MPDETGLIVSAPDSFGARRPVTVIKHLGAPAAGRLKSFSDAFEFR
jgi:hypothetical protein